MSIMGTRVLRTEDPRLLTEGGVYTDDLRLPELTGAAYVTVVRSPVAHALITGIDTSAATGTARRGRSAHLRRPARPAGGQRRHGSSRCSRPTGSATSASRWPWS